MKVIFLWAETGNYLHSLAKSVYKFTNQKLSIVNWDKRTGESTLFESIEEDGFVYLSRSSCFFTSFARIFQGLGGIFSKVFNISWYYSKNIT
jgi:hypothetical protein